MSCISATLGSFTLLLVASRARAGSSLQPTAEHTWCQTQERPARPQRLTFCVLSGSCTFVQAVSRKRSPRFVSHAPTSLATTTQPAGFLFVQLKKNIYTGIAGKKDLVSVCALDIGERRHGGVGGNSSGIMLHEISSAASSLKPNPLLG